MDATKRALGGLAAFCLSLCSPSTGAGVRDAVWKPQRLTFSYFGLTSKYACIEFESRVRNILRALGAHEEIQIYRRECSPATGMHLQIAFMAPIEATPENVRALTTYDAKQQLLARSKGIELPTAENLARFAAEWQEVSLSRDRRIGMRPGECELLEEVRRQLVPRFTTRSVPKRIVCVPGNLSSRPPPLSVSALIANADQSR